MAKSKYKIEDINDLYKQFNCELLEDTYIGVDTNMNFKCSCGRIGNMTFRSFRRSKHHVCRECLNEMASKRITKDIEEVKQLFIKYNCELLESQYISNDTPMLFRCNCGREDTKSYSTFSKKPQCKYCSFENLALERCHSYEYIFEYFKSFDCELLSKEYINSKTKLKYVAKCGHEDYVTFDSFKANKHHICYECSKQMQSGENSYNYKGGVYSSELEMFRKSYDFKKWQKDVFNRDDYTCQCCGDNKGGNLNAHHKDGYNWCVEKRVDVNNGVTLCKDCHKDFHLNYGFGNNTQQQFDNWLLNKVEMIKDVVLQ